MKDNNKVVEAVEEIKKVGVKVLRNDEWQIEEKLVLKERKVYILRDKRLRLEIIWLHHDILIAEHGGLSHTHDPSDSITDNAYISSAPPKTSVEVDIFLPVYILLLVQIYLVPSHVWSLHYWLHGSL